MTIKEKSDKIHNFCATMISCEGCPIFGLQTLNCYGDDATVSEIERNYDILFNGTNKLSADSYQALAMRTNDGLCTSRVHDSVFNYSTSKNKKDLPNPGELLNGALGLTGESGEVSDMIKKHIFHGHDLDRDELIKELGDVCWYVALLCNAIGVSLDEVMTRNIDKLRERYPEGFSESASRNRKE